MLTTVTVVGAILILALAGVYLKLRRTDVLGEFMAKRRGTAKLVTRAEYVEGREQIPVALSVTDDAFYYEGPEFEASFDLSRIDEIEYSDDLATGRDVHGCRVLRLRSHGQTFEFLIDKADAAKWEAALPPRTYGSQPAARAM